ncbi:hypothetical protein HDU96_004480, partial [Phlyctochytrium bullatum]
MQELVKSLDVALTASDRSNYTGNEASGPTAALSSELGTSNQPGYEFQAPASSDPPRHDKEGHEGIMGLTRLKQKTVISSNREAAITQSGHQADKGPLGLVKYLQKTADKLQLLRDIDRLNVKYSMEEILGHVPEDLKEFFLKHGLSELVEMNCDRRLTRDDIRHFIDEKCAKLERQERAFEVIRRLQIESMQGRFKGRSTIYLYHFALRTVREFQEESKDFDPEKMTLTDLDLETNFISFFKVDVEKVYRNDAGQPLSFDDIRTFIDENLVKLQEGAIEARRMKANNLRMRLQEHFPLASDIIPVFQRRDLKPGIIPLLCLPETETEGVDSYVPYNANNDADRWYIPQADVQELVLFNIKTFERRRVMVGK